MKTMTAVEAKNSFSQLLEATLLDPVAATRNHRKVAAMFSTEDVRALADSFLAAPLKADAVTLLAAHGFAVSASTGKPQEANYLLGLGASEVLERAEFSEKGRPLGKERFAAAVDSVGGQTLANVLSQIRYGGTLAACGLAQGFDLLMTVMPFILRGVTLAGVDSVMAPRNLRRAAWKMLAERMEPAALAAITRIESLDTVEKLAADLLSGRLRGRVVIPL